MQTRTILYADEGKVLTDGKTYGTIIYVEVGGSTDQYYEITKEEHEAILAEQEKAFESGEV